MKKNYTLRGNQQLYLIPLSDLHVGSEQFNEDYFQYRLETIDRIESDKRIYLCGDLLEAANKQIGNASFRTDMTLDDQLENVLLENSNSIPSQNSIQLVLEYDKIVNLRRKMFDLPTNLIDSKLVNKSSWFITSLRGL